MRRRTALLTLLLLIGLIAVPLVLTWREVRQEQWNHALIAAVDRNDTTGVRRLLRQGADPNAQVLPVDTRSVWTRLRDLLRHTPHPAQAAHGSALLEAVQQYYPMYHDPGVAPDLESNNTQIVKALADSGADVNARVTGDPEDGRWYHQMNRTTALIEAAYRTNWKAMQVLLAHHAEVNAADDFGNTALMYAAQGWGWGGEAMVKQLLERGAKVNVHDDRGETALVWVFDEDEEFRHGIMPVSRLESSSGSLWGTVALLLKYGADVNHADEDGQTALQWVVKKYGDKAIVGQLLADGANPNVADKRGNTPLSVAKRMNLPDVVALLQQAGAK